ncbi:MAG TPA: type I glutamate--ammonia ligase [Anaerolineales bacterium]
MFENLDQALKFVQDHQIQMVDLKFCGLWGAWHHVTLHASQFTRDTVESGIGFDGSSVGLRSVKSGDMVLVPDLTTGALDPFWDLPTLSFICNMLEADTHAVFADDPRNIAKRAEAHLRQTGVADESRWGPEFEFYVFDRAVFESGMNYAGYRLDSSEAEWTCADKGNGHPIPLHGGYHAAAPMDQLHNLRAAIAAHLHAMGVPVKYHHHEVGSAGQCEIETPMMGLVQSGDAAMLVKYVAKLAARAQGKTATFMPKPLYNEAGNGMHFHQHLFKGGKNIFFEPTAYANLSPTALYYIGGLLKHGAALLALVSPATNSYRRLVPGFEAPVNAFFSLGNRSAAVRIPKYANQSDSTRIEFRPPDATCNVYLALAAQLLAGLDGIQRRIDPTEAGYGPIDDDIFSWAADRRATIQRLPASLEEALMALKADHAFLLAGGVFSEDLIAKWIDHKMKAEVLQVMNRPHPYEMTLYF